MSEVTTPFRHSSLHRPALAMACRAPTAGELFAVTRNETRYPSTDPESARFHPYHPVH